MADHVAVLRERLKELAAKEGVCGQSDVRRLAFLDAIAAIEERDKLVARLGELERVFRLNATSSITATAIIYEKCADDLARVVKEGGG